MCAPDFRRQVSRRFRRPILAPRWPMARCTGGATVFRPGACLVSGAATLFAGRRPASSARSSPNRLSGSAWPRPAPAKPLATGSRAASYIGWRRAEPVERLDGTYKLDHRPESERDKSVLSRADERCWRPEQHPTSDRHFVTRHQSDYVTTAVRQQAQRAH